MQVRQADGSMSCDLRYRSHAIKQGKYSLPGLPAMYQEETGGADKAVAGQPADGGADMDCETLEIVLEDRASGLMVTLLYGVFPIHDIITRAVKIENMGNGSWPLKRCRARAWISFTGTMTGYSFTAGMPWNGTGRGQRYPMAPM